MSYDYSGCLKRLDVQSGLVSEKTPGDLVDIRKRIEKAKKSASKKNRFWIFYSKTGRGKWN